MITEYEYDLLDRTREEINYFRYLTILTCQKMAEKPKGGRAISCRRSSSASVEMEGSLPFLEDLRLSGKDDSPVADQEDSVETERTTSENTVTTPRKRGKTKRLFKSLRNRFSRTNSESKMDHTKVPRRKSGEEEKLECQRKKSATLPTKSTGPGGDFSLAGQRSDHSSATLHGKFRRLFKLSSRDSVVDDSPTSEDDDDSCTDENKQKEPDEFLDSGVDVSARQVPPSSVYSEKEVRQALGPSMRDVGSLLRVAHQHSPKTLSEPSSVLEGEDEHMSNRPPPPLPPEAQISPLSRPNWDVRGEYEDDGIYEKVTNCYDRDKGKSVPRWGGLAGLARQGWYWGPISRVEAEARLEGLPDGSFLVRDSADDRYMLSLSFRSEGRSLHSRIEYSTGLFSFYTFPDSENDGFVTVVQLIDHAMKFSQDGIFCFSRGRNVHSPTIPVRLTIPVSRFMKVRSLQDHCRFVIRQYTRFDQLKTLPLPKKFNAYLEQSPFLEPTPSV